jgi:hypothetical protein
MKTKILIIKNILDKWVLVKMVINMAQMLIFKTVLLKRKKAQKKNKNQK